MVAGLKRSETKAIRALAKRAGCLLSAWCCLLFSAATTCAAPQVRAELNRQVLPPGESVILSLTFEGGAPAGVPTLPPIPNVNVLGTSQRSEFTFANGVSSGRQVFEFTLVATQPGDVTIPAMQFQAGGQIVTTQPLILKVLQGNSPTAT